MENLYKQTLALQIMQCTVCGLGIWSSTSAAAAATGLVNGTSDSISAKPQRDAISAVFVLVLVASMATVLVFMSRVRRNSKMAKAEGVEVWAGGGVSRAAGHASSCAEGRGLAHECFTPYAIVAS